MRRKKLLSIILSITLVLSMCASFSTLHHERMEEDVWDKTGALDEAPIVEKSMDYNYYCKDCGCNFYDLLSLECYKENGFYDLGGGKENYDFEHSATLKDENGNTSVSNISFVLFDHLCPRDTVDFVTGKLYKKSEKCPANGSTQTWQPFDDLPMHTEPEIAKIVPKVQITCSKENWNMNLQGTAALGMNYTGKEQHPEVRILSDGKVLNKNTYYVFYRKFDNMYTVDSEGRYSASDPCPYSDDCIEKGRYVVEIRFKENSIFRGCTNVEFDILDPIPAPDPTPTSGYVSSEKLKAEVNKSTKLSDEDKEYMCECIDIGKTKDGLTKIKSFVDSEWYLPSGDTITSAFLQSLVDAALGTDNTSEEKTTEKQKTTTEESGNKNKDEKTTEKQVTTEKQPNTQKPTVTTTSVTETQVTTQQKIVKGDIFRSKTAQYTVTGSNTISFDTPLKRTKKVTVPATVKVNKKTYKVTSVKSKAFKGNTKLTTLVVGSNVKTLGSNCCNGCINLKKITVNSKKLETIGAGAFKGCVKLKVAKFKSTKLKTLNTGAFRNCSKLTTVEIKSKKLVKIGTYAFDGCGKLKNITIKSSKVKFYKGCFRKISKKATFKVPKRKVKAYAKSVVKKGKAPKTVSVK